MLARLEVEDAYRFDRNLGVQAGAGTGKTHALVSTALSLLGGLGARGAVAPARLLLLTFGEDAAAEIRARLARRVAALEAAPDAPDALMDLPRAATPPGRAHWEAVRRELGAATIGNFHQLGAALLRRHAAAAAVDPDFALVDETEAFALLEEAAQGALLDALVSSDPRVAEPARAAARAFPVGGRKGLLDLAVGLHARFVEEGIGHEAAALAPLGAPYDRSRAAAALAAETARARAALGALERSGRASARIAGAMQAGAAFARAAAALLGEDSGGATGALHAGAGALAGGGGGAPGKAMDGATLWQFHEAAVALHKATAQLRSTEAAADREALRAALVRAARAARTWLAAPAVHGLLALLEATAGRYRAAKRARGALDFGDLLLRTRDLLRDRRDVRAAVKARWDAVLVDEFQDTNRVQRDLVRLLAEPPGVHAALAPADDAGERLAVGERRLFVVGDLKQCIYEFRGADVTVFSETLEALARTGGAGEVVLSRSRRAVPALVRFTNALFTHVMAEAREPFEIRFDEAHALAPLRDDVPGGGVELLEFDAGPETGARAREADAVAARIGALGRPLRDVAILLRRFTHVEEYRQALRRAGLPHYVVGGRGLYDTQEARDLASLLALATGEADADPVALLTVLRSPLCLVSDRTLLALALPVPRAAKTASPGETAARDDAGEGAAPGAAGEDPGHGATAAGSLRLDPRAVRRAAGDDALLAGLGVPPDERARLRRFVALWERLEAQADRLGAAGTLRRALDETDLCAVLAATSDGVQKVANVERLVELAGAQDAAPGGGGARGFAARLRRAVQRAPDEEEGAPVAEDADVVKVMTIHRAKGLEFPVVVLPGLGDARAFAPPAVLWERTAGLAVKLPRLPRDFADTGDWERVHARSEAREEAEEARIFYVACTRARDLLVLCGPAAVGSGSGRGRGGAWRAALEEIAPLHVVAPGAGAAADPLFLRIRASSLPPPVARDAATETPPTVTAADVARAFAPPPLAPARLEATVTALADLDACPRRYHFLHEIHLLEHPDRARREDTGPGGEDARAAHFGQRADEPAAGAGAGDGEDAPWDPGPIARGVLAHRLLERAAPGATAAELRAGLGADLSPDEEASPEATALADDVAAFLAGSAGRMLAEPGARREVPFVLRVAGPLAAAARAGRPAPEMLVHGQIDLLVDRGPQEPVLVLDYKYARRDPRALDAYRFQLLAYAVAVRTLLPRGPLPRAGLVFLRDRGAPPVWLPVAPASPISPGSSATAGQAGGTGDASAATAAAQAATLDEMERTLARLCGTLAQSRAAGATGAWPGRPRDFCERLGCGYIYRCHAEAGGVDGVDPDASGVDG
ncbi:MAG TPA: UvrD-helicase domain-containing protein [Myxococcota bacterium]|nr:UvrD-helicase domain-containing protein [Myxococcota bacterium]